MSTSEHLPLTGVRVLDFTRILSGPYCTLLLSELGAEVIKVERPGTGDDTRAWGPPFTDEEQATSAYFAAVNRGKRSVAIDMSHSEGLDLVWRLASKCDVVIENFRPGVAERYGLDHESLSARNERVVTCSISGYGREGAYADYPGTEIVVEGMSGLMSVTGPRDGEPVRFGIAMTDIATGLTAATRIVAGVMQARQTGQGSHIEASLYGTAIGVLGTLVASASVTGQSPGRWGSHHPSIVPYGGFPTADGDVITGVVNDKMWPDFCRTIGCTELLDDPELHTNPGRVRHRDKVESAVASATRRHKTGELLAALREKGLLAAPIRTVDEMLADPATAELGLTVPVAGHPRLLTSRVSGLPADPVPERVPALGEGSERILTTLGGLTPEAYDRLRGAGVISG